MKKSLAWVLQLRKLVVLARVPQLLVPQAKYIYGTGLSGLAVLDWIRLTWMLQENDKLLTQIAAQETTRNNSLLKQDALNIFSSGDVDLLSNNFVD